MRRRRTPSAVVALGLAAIVALLAGCARGDRSTPPTSVPATPSTPVAPGPDGVPVPGTAPPRTGPWSAEPAVAPAGRTIEGALRTPDGRERTYRVYAPASLRPGVPVPLLVAMHGGLGSAAQFQENSGFDGVAEANGFVVVYPDGIGSPVKEDFAQTWNGGYCCGPAVVQGVDDVAFLRQLVGELQRTYVIDPARIYAAGHSNGGIMAYRLACEAADVFVAIGLQASSLGVDPCEPSEPVSLIHVHGLADRNHPIDGGRGEGVANVVFHPAIDGVRTIAGADDCPAEPVTTTDPANPDVTIATWQPCAEGSEVQLVTVAGASHAWMGGTPRPIQRALVGETYDRYSSAAAIWAFLAAHPRR